MNRSIRSALAASVNLMRVLLLASPGAAAAQGEERFTATPLPIVVDRVAPTVLAQPEPGHLFVDFGQDSFAGLELTVPDPQPGQKLTVTLGEKLAGPRTIDRKPGGSVRCVVATLVLEADKKIYLVPLPPRDQRRMSAPAGPVMPFRYVEIEGTPPGLDNDRGPLRS